MTHINEGEVFVSTQTGTWTSIGVAEEKDSTLTIFETQFKEKYKIEFSDFIVAILKDYPELKI